jgi:hypothetical protein
MAKTKSALLGFGASGQIGKSQVYATWRGVPYARRHVIPANPQSTEQTKTRSVFAFLSSVWKVLPTLGQAPWTLFAQGQPLTNRNAFIGKNTKLLRAGTTLADMIMSPGAKGGLSALSLTVTPGANQLTVAFANPAAPTGWTLTAAVACAILEQDPHVDSSFVATVAEDTATHDSVILTGLQAAEYRVFGWLQWTKPDGSTAYGVSINTTGTPT